MLNHKGLRKLIMKAWKCLILVLLMYRKNYPSPLRKLEILGETHWAILSLQGGKGRNASIAQVELHRLNCIELSS